MDLHWKYFFFEPVAWPCLSVAIHENVTPRRMSMEITKEEYFSRLLSFLHH